MIAYSFLDPDGAEVERGIDRPENATAKAARFMSAQASEGLRGSIEFREPTPAEISEWMGGAEPASRPEIRSFLTCSASHLRQKDYDLITSDETHWRFVGEVGIFLYAPEVEPGENPHEHPEYLVKLLAYARSLGCAYVLFDQDGEMLPDFPTFDGEGGEDVPGLPALDPPSPDAEPAWLDYCRQIAEQSGRPIGERRGDPATDEAGRQARLLEEREYLLQNPGDNPFEAGRVRDRIAAIDRDTGEAGDAA
jgi:hypothetical protein